MLEKNSVLAVVVTFHPGRSFAECFASLAGQVGGMLIVDNNSGVEAVSMLRAAAICLNAKLIENTSNVGLAAALNIAIREAISRGYEWVLLFDQDTAPGDHVLQGLRAVLDQYPEKEKLAVIGSNYTIRDTGKPRFPDVVEKDCAWRERKTVITSGSLVSLRAYRMIGPFREEYFIDCVDLEFCLRARSRGMEVISTCKPLMVHGIGQSTRHRLPWREIDVSNHSRMRWYYMIRNDVDLAKHYFVREPVWVLTSLWTRLKSMIGVCLFEKDRIAKIRYSVVGLYDGLYSKFDRKLR